MAAVRPAPTPSVMASAGDGGHDASSEDEPLPSTLLVSGTGEGNAENKDDTPFP